MTMLQSQIRRVTDTSVWSASADLANLNVPRDGVITEIKLRAAVTMSAPITAIQPDGLTRIIQNFKLEGDGGRAFYGFSGEQMGRLMFLMSMYDFGTPTISLIDAATEQITWVLHPGSNPRNPFDTTAVIPAKNLSTLLAKITTTANTVVDDTLTISSAIFSYEISQVLGVPVTPDMKVPQGSSQTWTQPTTYSDFSGILDVPTGNWLRRIFILSQDETATRPVRKDDEVTGVKLYVPGKSAIYLESNWEDLKVEGVIRSRMPGYQFQVADELAGRQNLPDGMVCIDLRKFQGAGFSPVYGMDLRGAQAGNIKIGFTVGSNAAGDDTLIYWDQLADMPSSMLG